MIGQEGQIRGSDSLNPPIVSCRENLASSRLDIQRHVRIIHRACIALRSGSILGVRRQRILGGFRNPRGIERPQRTGGRRPQLLPFGQHPSTAVDLIPGQRNRDGIRIGDGSVGLRWGKISVLADAGHPATLRIVIVSRIDQPLLHQGDVVGIPRRCREGAQLPIDRCDGWKARGGGCLARHYRGTRESGQSAPLPRRPIVNAHQSAHIRSNEKRGTGGQRHGSECHIRHQRDRSGI